MSVEAKNPVKVFSVLQANATLPLVRQIARDMVELSTDMEDRRERLTHLMSGRDMSSGDPYDDELAEMQSNLEKDSVRLMGYFDELEKIGVELKSPTEGLIDFPSMIDGELAYLCWKFNEPEIRFWHALNAGFSGRRPLPSSREVDNPSSPSLQA